MPTAPPPPSPLRVLVLDIGGTHVKALLPGATEPQKLDSGPKITPDRVVAWVHLIAKSNRFNRASIGYPGLVVHDHIACEPWNLGTGWMGFHFDKALRCPTRILNDAAMQALGSYKGGRMLFLGLGTGLGSAMVVEGAVQAMELAHLPYKKNKSYEDYVGLAGLQRRGKHKWRKSVFDVIERLRAALEPTDIVLGGGNAKKLGALPPGVRLGDNANAFKGGLAIWSDAA